MSNQPNLLYIAGAGKSGSTLLDLLLGGHKDMHSLGEIAFLNRYLEHDVMCTCGSLVAECQFWKPVLSKTTNTEQLPDALSLSKSLKLDVSRESQNKPFGQLQFYAAAAFFCAFGKTKMRRSFFEFLFPSLSKRAKATLIFFEHIRDESNRKILIDCSKHAFRYRLLESFSDSDTKVIFLVRDGRAHAYSDIKKFGVSMSDAAKNWCRVNVNTARLLRTLPQDQVLHLTYSELCNDVESTLKKICLFLNIEFDSNMLEIEQSELHTIGGNRARFTGYSVIKEDLSWRDGLSKEEIKTFDSICGDYNRKMLGEYHSDY